MLSLAPSFILYKSTKLSENRAISVCLYGGIAYFLTQLLKMIFLATLIPSSIDPVSQEIYNNSLVGIDFNQEMLRIISSLADILGIHAVLQQISRSYEGDLKILGVGLGWATMESFLVRIAPFWIGARSLEFDSIHILSALEANVNLIMYIAWAGIIWLWGRRRRVERKEFSLLMIILFASLLWPSFISVLKIHYGPWYSLLFQIISMITFGIVSKTLYSMHERN